MSPEENILVLCSRLGFTEEHQERILDLCRDEQIDWKVLLATARIHGVAPLVYANLSQCSLSQLGIPHWIIEQFQLSFAQNLVRKRRLSDKLADTLRFFQQAGIEVMLIKGAAHDLLLHKSRPFTVSRDVDIVIRSSKEEIKAETLEQIMSLPNQFPLEFDFESHHDLDLNGVLPIDFGQIWEDAVKIPFTGGDVEVYVMSPEDLLIAACINSCRKRYFNLKAICNIDAILGQSNAIDWNEVTRRAISFHCKHIVYTALLVTRSLLDTALPAGTLERLAGARFRVAITSILTKRMSFSSLRALYSGSKLFDRHIGMSLLLPYATYQLDQVWRKSQLFLGGAPALSN